MGDGRGGRGGHRGKKRDLGRSAWSKQKGDKRKQNSEEQARKRRRIDNDGEDGPRGTEKSDDGPLPLYATKFTEEEVKAEERRPKRKVAVLIGYSGTGYRGMQLAPDQKTIEGDLFKAFVAAGAISKANAEDPKKSSFVRCARTDKGVHAAGNVISLKLIVEDDNIVEKINSNLNPQIRVWGLERTNNSFSAYQMVDSRIYEYLIPSHSFLPPHPRSYLGRKCAEWAEKKGQTEEWKARQQEVAGFWEKIDEESIEPILQEYDSDVRDILEKALWLKTEEEISAPNDEGMVGGPSRLDSEAAPLSSTEPDENGTGQDGGSERRPAAATSEQGSQRPPMTEEEIAARRARTSMINDAVKKLRKAYVDSKRSFRIPEARFDRVKAALGLYVGTRNFHNYTVEKSPTDPSAKRVIKSFVPDPNRILIDGTEWLSLKVHGQSFMMHQIRKMVGMVALVVRCGCDPARIVDSYAKDPISIPKAPSLGLLLERPIFDSYNRRAARELGKEAISFDKFQRVIDEFKQREIYERMYRDEEKENVFGNFFNHVDNFPSETFLFVTAGGVEATRVKDADATDRASKEKIGLAGAMANASGTDGSQGRGRGVDDDDEEEDEDDARGDGAGNEG